ncbi:LCP family protein [Kocuria palustris]|uniref:LCP family protein n=1 Tax=Kocuria palustris TaxID=71999 RepID=UPI0021B320F9|nr:LCP family protein [Kocuria palustris]
MTGPQLPRDPRRRRSDGRSAADRPFDVARGDGSTAAGHWADASPSARRTGQEQARDGGRPGPAGQDEQRWDGQGGRRDGRPGQDGWNDGDGRYGGGRDDWGGWDDDARPQDDGWDDDIAAEVPADARLSSRQGAGSWDRALEDPSFVSPGRRTWRAWLLILGTLVFPGSAQIAAGHRRLGRIALPITVACWAIAIVVLLSGLLWRNPLVFLLTNSLSGRVIWLGLVAAAIWWAVLFLDTLRLIRPGLLEQRARALTCAGLALLMVVTSGGLLYSAHLLSVTRGTVGEIFAGGMPFRPSDGRYNILLMGADAGEDRVGLRPDSMTVLSIDADSGQTATISLPRNLQNVPFPDDSPMHEVYPEGYSCGDECLLNAVYTDVMQNHPDVYGDDVEDPGVEAMKDAASGALGIDIQGYAMIDMNGFEQLIDALGGITIDVGGEVPIGGGTNEITGEPNPIDGYIEPGVQELDGFHALWYARSREGASDYDRQARQRCVQAAMLQQLNPANVVTQFEELADAGTQVVETDIPQASLGSFVDLAVQAKDHDLVPYAAGPPYYDAVFPTYPDYDQLHADVQELLDSAQGEDPQAAGPSVGGGPLGSSALVAVPAQTADDGGGEETPELSANGTCSVP